MKSFDRIAAQGDFLIIRIDDIPDDVEPYEAEKGQYVVAHSETGHNHTMVKDRVKAYRPKETSDEDLYRLFFEVEAPTEIVHERSHDTHETLWLGQASMRYAVSANTRLRDSAGPPTNLS